MREEIKGVLGRMYENFLMRDLTYVFSGSLILACIYYTFENDLEIAIDYVSKSFLTFIIFLGISYFIGLIVQEGVSFIKVVNTGVTVPKPYKDFILIMADIDKIYGIETIRRIERIIYLKHIGAAMGAASFISTLIFLVRLIKKHEISDIIVFSVLLALTVICLRENRWKIKQQNETLQHLAEDMRKKPSNKE